MTITDFKDLPIWQESIILTKEIYDISAKKEFSRDFGLRDQIRRAIVSVSSNIVEGFEKSNNNELVRYFKISKGSVGEVRNQIEIAKIVGYVSESEAAVLDKELLNLASQIAGFIKYLEEKKKLAISNKK
jgi:four helix bundle protein